MLQAKNLKDFLKTIPDDAVIIFNENHIMFQFSPHNMRALNKQEAIWDNGIGYFESSTSCGECSHFDCSKCVGNKQTEEVKNDQRKI